MKNKLRTESYLKLALLLVLNILVLSSATAQKDKNKLERLEAQRIAYITAELDLSSQEAQQFWPVYNAHEKERKELYIRKKQLYSQLSKDEITEEEAGNAVQTILDIESSEVSQKEKYTQDLLGILSAKKVLKLFKSEKNFRRNLMKKMRGSRKKPDRDR